MRQVIRHPFFGAVFVLAVPLGLIAIHVTRTYSRGVGPPFDWLEVALALVLSAFTYAGLSWSHSRRERNLEEKSLTDSMTKLWNRTHLLQRLPEEIERAKRYRQPLSLLFIDVDHLKQLNDQAGDHRVGDDALVQIARCIQTSCRTTDLPTRYGGDEFALLAPHTDGKEALTLAERIRLSVKQSGSGQLSVSIGVADLSDGEVSRAEDLCEMADRALYRAKALGRNRVCRIDRAEQPNEMARMLQLHIRRRDVFSSSGISCGELRVFCPRQKKLTTVDECSSCSNFGGRLPGSASSLGCVQCLDNAAPPQPVPRADEVSSIMNSTVVCLKPHVDLQTALGILRTSQVRGAPVLDEDGKLLGLLSESDILHAWLGDESDPKRTTHLPRTVEQAMMPMVFALQQNASISQAAGLMTSEGVHKLLVVTPRGELIGILSALDVLKWLAQREGTLQRAGKSTPFPNTTPRLAAASIPPPKHPATSS